MAQLTNSLACGNLALSFTCPAPCPKGTSISVHRSRYFWDGVECCLSISSICVEKHRHKEIWRLPPACLRYTLVRVSCLPSKLWFSDSWCEAHELQRLWVYEHLFSTDLPSTTLPWSYESNSRDPELKCETWHCGGQKHGIYKWDTLKCHNAQHDLS